MLSLFAYNRLTSYPIIFAINLLSMHADKNQSYISTSTDTIKLHVQLISAGFMLFANKLIILENTRKQVIATASEDHRFRTWKTLITV